MTAAFSRIMVLATNTFREAVRNRAFIALMIASLVLILSSMLLAELAVVGQSQRVLQDFGLFFISLMGVIIAVTTGVILVFKELERKTIYTVLARPLHRWEFIIGKYLGMLLILLVEIGFLAGIWFLVMLVGGVELRLVFVKAVILIYGELMVVSAFALLFSAFSTPILSGLLTLAIFLVGRVTYIIDEMLLAQRGIFVDVPSLRPLGEAGTRVFPDLSLFNISKEILLNKEVTILYMAQTYGYALCYIAVLMVCAVLFFRRRDFV